MRVIRAIRVIRIIRVIRVFRAIIVMRVIRVIISTRFIRFPEGYEFLTRLLELSHNHSVRLGVMRCDCGLLGL